MRSEQLTTYLDELLGVGNLPDYPPAHNGLQVASSGRDIERVAVAVDASQATIDEAVAAGADLLIVHHGLFWDGTQPLTGRRYRRVKALLDADVALYGAHLPLDVHPTLGNNAVLASELGLPIAGRFGDFKGTPIGVWGELGIRREALAARLDQVLGSRVRMIGGGPERVERIGIITGGAGSQVAAAREAGLDALITGEGDHHHFFDASEGGINLYLGGHYATEVWGVRALGEHLEAEMGVESIFLDHPTGL